MQWVGGNCRLEGIDGEEGDNKHGRDGTCEVGKRLQKGDVASPINI